MSGNQPDHLNCSKTISETALENAVVAGQQLSVLAAVVKATNLFDTLSSPGPFTVFAPTDAAFAKLPAGEIELLFKPENRIRLTAVATYHILAGQLTTEDLRQRAQANDGRLTLRTVEGDTINIEHHGERLRVIGSRGTHADLTISDLLQSNGVIHVMDAVLSPPAW